MSPFYTTIPYSLGPLLPPYHIHSTVSERGDNKSAYFSTGYLTELATSTGVAFAGLGWVLYYKSRLVDEARLRFQDVVQYNWCAVVGGCNFSHK